MSNTETIAGVAQGVLAGDKAIYVPVHGFLSEGVDKAMPSYKVKLIIEGGRSDGQTKTFNVNASSISDAIDEAMRQAQQQDPEVTGGFIDEIE